MSIFRSSSSSKAFTLLELIVVIVILGILAALAIPTFRQVISEASYETLEASVYSLDREALALAAFTSEASSATDPSNAANGSFLETALIDLEADNLNVTKVSELAYNVSDTSKGLSVCLTLSGVPGQTGVVTREACDPDDTSGPGTPPVVSSGNRAVWVWEETAALTSNGNTAVSLAAWAEDNEVNAIYLHRGWNPDETDQEYSAALSTALDARGIELYAAGAGDSDWWDDGSLNASIWAERQTSTGDFDGIHLDLEPWAGGTSAPELTNYVAALSNVKTVTSDAGVKLDVATNPLLSAYSDTNGEFLYQVTELADSTTMMGFRDTSAALLERTAPALSYAEAANKPIRFGISVEPVAVVENCAHCTFDEEGQGALEAAESEIEAALSSSSVYQGFAIQNYYYWSALLER